MKNFIALAVMAIMFTVTVAEAKKPFFKKSGSSSSYFKKKSY